MRGQVTMLNFLDKVCKPTKGSKHSAAIDLYAREDVMIYADTTVIIPLGVTIDIQKIDEYILKTIPYGVEESLVKKADNFMNSHYLQLEPRSSIRAKGLQAGTGIIDLDYVDEIKLILHGSDSKYTVHKGDKIAQIMLCEHKTYLMGVETEDVRDGGLGSTGS